MYAGLDFGTSTCSIGVWSDESPVLLPLEGSNTRLLSALYTYRAQIDGKEVDQSKLHKRIRDAKTELTKAARLAQEEGRRFLMPSNEEIERQLRGVLRRENAAELLERYRDQSVHEALHVDADLYFGEQALAKHIKEPFDGYFVKSPKSFLGADLRSDMRNLYSVIVQRMLAHIKSSGERTTGSSIEDIVLGRPVNFHGTNGESGNRQAMRILSEAASSAGFREVNYLLEPIAAAMDFERTLSRDLVVLVLDIGGGTTDCSMVHVGPSSKDIVDRDRSVLGSAGTRVGGVDIDMKLAFRKIMPMLGRGSQLNSGLPIPSSVYWNAVAINDINAHAEFLSEKTKREIDGLLDRAQEKKLVGRLKVLQGSRLSFRLNRSSELAKIHLSDREMINLPLRYIEPEWVIQITRDDLRESIDRELDLFVSLASEVEKQAGAAPDLVYITGGTAKSPVVDEWIRAKYRDVEIVVGDVFGSVTSGLTTWAQRIYS